MTEKTERHMRTIQWPLECRPYFDSSERSGGVSLRSKTVEDAALSSLWTVPELCKAYRWPRDLAGGGVIGILAMAGGYRRSDFKTYFDDLDEPMPTIIDVLEASQIHNVEAVVVVGCVQQDVSVGQQILDLLDECGELLTILIRLVDRFGF